MTFAQWLVLATTVAFLIWLVCKAAFYTFFKEKREFVDWLVQRSRGNHAKD